MFHISIMLKFRGGSQFKTCGPWQLPETFCENFKTIVYIVSVDVKNQKKNIQIWKDYFHKDA